MADTTISPNMNMPIPTVSEAPGPGWATNLDSCLYITDSHNHTPGQGVAITPAAIDINTDLPLNGNNLITARTLRFDPQSSTPALPADLGCLYEAGVDLYYIDGSGNNIRLTQSGSPAGATGTITGLPSGTASASFAGSTFTFQSATNTPAIFNIGPVKIGQPVAAGFGVTISPNVAQAANYNVTLPVALPSLSSAVISDTSGNLSFTPITSGTYTPTVTPGSFGAAQAALAPFFYQRVGDIVTVTGYLTGDTTLQVPGIHTIECFVTLPINPTAFFASVYDVVGVLGNYESSIVQAVRNDVNASVASYLTLIDLSWSNSRTNVQYTISFTYSCA